jgi:hypothetical protein
LLHPNATTPNYRIQRHHLDVCPCFLSALLVSGFENTPLFV